MEEIIKKEETNTSLNKNKGGMSALKKFFSARRLVFIAIFIALSYAVSFLEIPLPLFGASFLKLDFGNVFIVLVSFLLGPIEGILVCLCKEGLRCISSSSLCAGEIANFLTTSAYLLFPSILYRYKKGLKSVLISLLISGIFATGISLACNRFIIFPVYAYLFGGSIFGMTVQEAFSLFWIGILLFNFIKTTLVGVFTILLYKRLSTFIKKLKI